MKGTSADTVIEALKAAGKAGLRNAEIQTISRLSRSQVKRLMNDLKTQGRAVFRGKGQAAR